MTKVMSGAAMLAAMFITATAPAFAAGPICLASRDIKDTDAQKDGAAILYTMKDGSVWRNDLRGRCPTIRWNGFGYSTANPQSSICENEQTLVDFRTGETCGLGHFTQVSPARMEHQASR
jgi:hypothetical protein